METQLETFSGAADHALFAQILQCQDAILTGVKQGRMLAAGERPQAAVVPLVAPVPAPVVEEPVVAAVVEEEPIAQEIIEEVAAPAIEVMDLGISEDADPEMFALFLEEASELVEDLETQIDAWRSAPEDKSFCDSLKRILHTFKGGARMTGIMALGELAHDLETQLEQFSGVADDALFATINDYYEKMLKGVAQVKRIVAGESVAIAPVAPVVAEKTAVSPQPAAKKPTDTPAPQSATIIPFRGGQLPRGLEDAIAGRKATHAAVDAKAAQAQQEMVKVSADLLENLVNLAGETSISRARVEQQMIDIEKTFGALLKQLPDKSQMDGLLTDINQAGLGRGLEFDLFKPGQETVADFYAEMPIQIKIKGNYHDVGAFATDISKLSRIVTLNDLNIAPLNKDTKDSVLVMEATAKTYRYLDSSEIAAKKAVEMKDKKK